MSEGQKVEQVRKRNLLRNWGYCKSATLSPHSIRVAGKCHVDSHSTCSELAGVARWHISQLHRFKLSLPFNSFLPRVTVINLVLHEPLTPHSTLLPDGVGSTSVVPVTTAISGSSADSVKYCCVCGGKTGVWNAQQLHTSA